MITKFLLVSLCIVTGTMTGLVFSKRLTRRDDYFKSLAKLIEYVIAEVKFRKNTTKAIMADFMKSNNSLLNTHLSEYIACENISQINLSKTALTKVEVEEVKKLFCSLGTFDAETQLTELENYKIRFSAFASEAHEKRKKLGSMYVKLGFFAGLALGILLL